MRIFLIGDSHVRAMMRVLRGEPEIRERVVATNVLRPFSKLLTPFFELEGRTLRFTVPEFEAKLEASTGAPTIELDPKTQYIVLMPFTTTLMLRSGTWLSFRPSWIPDSSRTPLSAGLIERIVRDRFRYGLDLIAQIKGAGAQVAVLESPPPRGDDPRTVTYGAEVILGVDRFARDIIASSLADGGIDVIPVPVEAYDGAPGASFLKKSFSVEREGDYHHTNARYARLALRQVLAYTDSRES